MSHVDPCGSTRAASPSPWGVAGLGLLFVATGLLFTAVPTWAQGAWNVELLSHVHSSGGRQAFAACWGYTAPDGRELAMIGTASDTEFYDVTDGRHPVLVAEIPGPHSNWREMQTWSHYAYIVTEGTGLESSGVQIVDLSNPRAPRYVGSYDSTITTAHTIHVRDGYAYVNGTTHNGVQSGWRILDLSDPERPREVGSWRDRYVHDCFVRGDRAYLANISSGGFTILNIADRSHPFELSFTSYPGAATHNCWTTDDGAYLLTTDEVSGGMLHIWSLADERFPAEVSTWQAANPSSSIHNVVVNGDSAYIAYYTEGLQVLDIANPSSPQLVGWYDTFPGLGGLFDGNWGVYPLAHNGNIYLSDIASGLFIVRMATGGQPILDFSVGAPEGQTTSDAGPVTFYFDLYNGAGGARTYDLTASSTPAWPVDVQPTIGVQRGSTEPVVVTVAVPQGVTSATRVDVELCVRNQSSGFSRCVHTRLAVPVVLSDFEARGSGDAVELRWTVSHDAVDQGELLVLRARREPAAPPDPSAFTLRTRAALGSGSWRDAEIEPGATYIYRLALESNRRLQILGERSVTADVPSRTRLLGSAPNPFNPATQVRFELARGGDAVLEVFDARGRRVRAMTAPGLGAGAHSIAWDGRDASGRVLPSGVYLYEIRSGAWRGRGRMTLAK